jgi:hypothetical protein
VSTQFKLTNISNRQTADIQNARKKENNTLEDTRKPADIEVTLLWSLSKTNFLKEQEILCYMKFSGKLV